MNMYDISFRCYFPGEGQYTTHRQTLPVEQIGKWIEAYRFTHPNVQSISAKVWFDEEVEE